MAARAEQLRDVGVNASSNWNFPFGTGQVHIGVTAFSDTAAKWRRAVAVARKQAIGLSGVTIIHMHDFGAQPGSLNPFGYKDGIGQPAIAGSGMVPLPGQGQPIKAGEFILGYPGEADLAYPMPQPDVLGRTAPTSAFASTSPASARSIASSRPTQARTKSGNCLRPSSSAAGAAGRR